VSASKIAYIGLGSNLGDRRANLDQALDQLKRDPALGLRRVSSYEQTPALGDGTQPDYLNAVAEIDTGLAPAALLERLKEIEDGLGRKRYRRWGPRTIDLDLLLLGNAVLDSPQLTIPHADMHLRSFVTAPMARLNPGLMHPVLKVSMKELNERLHGGNFHPDRDKPQLISVAGNIGVGKTTLAEHLAAGLETAVIYEPYDTNPFMPEVYAGQTAYALDSELYFLVHRTEQLSKQRLSPGRVVVSDYLFEKMTIYSRCLLEERQLFLYQKIYAPFAQAVADPVLVLYLHDSSNHCLDRIHHRNRVYEQGIRTDFLDRLDTEYESLVGRWTRSPIIRLDVDRFDCLNPVHMEELTRQVRHYVYIEQGARKAS